MNSAIVSCARFRLEIRRCSSRWASPADVPPEVHSLDDTISALHHLLDSAVRAGATAPHSHFQSKHNGLAEELRLNLNAAERLMQHLEKVLQDVLSPVHDADNTEATAGSSRLQLFMTRWTVQREKFLKLHAELKERHHRLLAGLTRLTAVYDQRHFTRLVRLPSLTTVSAHKESRRRTFLVWPAAASRTSTMVRTVRMTFHQNPNPHCGCTRYSQNPTLLVK